MGDRKTLAMARKELEDMYVGVPDESVNLSFQDLAQVINKKTEKKKLSPSSSSSMPPISESDPPAALARIPSLDFSRALQDVSINHSHHYNHQTGNITPHHHHQIDHTTPHHLHHQIDDHTTPHHHLHHHQIDGHATPHHLHLHHHQLPPHHHNHHGTGFRPTPAMYQRSFMSEEMSHLSGMSAVDYGEGGRRRRPGIPHSNICTVCSTYIYILRHRCLVCGRVYCRQCVAIGMGEMTEGRKCKDCLGRRFSQRYISKAGNIGCCFGYPSTVKQQELIWAEKGPRTGVEATLHHRRSPRPPPIPTGHHSNPPSFIATSPYHHNNHHQFAPL